MDFKNLMLLVGNTYEKFDVTDSSLFTRSKKDNQIYKIIEIETKNYDCFYKSKVKLMKECEREDLTTNFGYYFSSPKKKCKMKFCMSLKSRELLFTILTFAKNKIRCILSPYGNGKMTSLITLSRNKDGICFLNLKALNNKAYNLNLWKSDLFLLEVFNLFKMNKNQIYLIL